jgi:hypothetical protein
MHCNSVSPLFLLVRIQTLYMRSEQADLVREHRNGPRLGPRDTG